MGRRRIGAFSLIELLVVITIILILIALLLPGLTGAMARARQTKCLSNCQQAVEALSTYAAENRTVFPMMPVPAGLNLIRNQYMYGGLAGLFSLEQRGDGGHKGYGAATNGGVYCNGVREPLLRSYITSLGALTCPSDREDLYYGDPYSPTNQMSYASAVPLRPMVCTKDQDVITYNLSYTFFTGQTSSGPGSPLWADETNGPDLDAFAWYGDGRALIGGSTPNSLAAGSSGVGSYAKVDNHGATGGNIAFSDGSGKFPPSPAFPLQGNMGVID